MARSDSSTALNQDLVTGHDIEGRHVTLQALRHQGHCRKVLVIQLERRGLVEHLEYRLRVVAQRAHKYRSGELSTSINTSKDLILGIEFKIKP